MKLSKLLTSSIAAMSGTIGSASAKLGTTYNAPDERVVYKSRQVQRQIDRLLADNYALRNKSNGDMAVKMSRKFMVDINNRIIEHISA